MCYGKTKCERPKELKGNAKACSPKQIKKCHGQAEEHPCVKTGKKRK